MKNFVFFGLPASGKGTQASIINSFYDNVSLLSMGQLLRNEINKQSDLGYKIKESIVNGFLVGDEIINQMCDDFLKNNKSNFIIYDGYPRTISQAIHLNDSLLHLYDVSITAVFYFILSEEIILRRISSRFVCKKCGAVFNSLLKPTIKSGVCDFCSSVEFFIRDDDKPDVVKSRIVCNKKYINELLEFYSERKIPIFNIDADKQPEHISMILKQNIDSFC